MDGTTDQRATHLREPRILAGHELPPDMLLPAHAGHSLLNLPATVLHHFGVTGPETAPLAPDVVGDQLAGARKLVVLLLDALGWLPFAAQLAEDQRLGLRRLAERGELGPLTTIFPSTTAATLSTLHTALPPAAHGILGYRMWLPERGFIANMIRLSPDSDERPGRLVAKPGDAAELLGVPTVHQRLTRAGVRSYCLLQSHLADSGLSRMTHQGCTATVPFVCFSDLCRRIKELVLADPGEPAAIWAYWDAFDTLQHTYGTWGEAPAAEVRAVDAVLTRELVEPLAGTDAHAALLLTADHGHVQVDAGDIVPLPRLGRLVEGLVLPPTCGGRAACLHVRDGRGEELSTYLAAALRDRALVVRTADALADGLWGPGPVRADVPRRLGDLLLLPLGTRGLWYPHRPDSKPQDMVGGRHGGLHELEMLIPLLCARL